MVIDFGLAVLAERRSMLTASGFVVGFGACACRPGRHAASSSRPGPPTCTPSAPVLLYAATGHYPYTGPSRQAVALRIEGPDTPPDLDGLPPVLRPAITAMLALDPVERPGLDEGRTQLIQFIRDSGLSPTQAKRHLTDPSLPELCPRSSTRPPVTEPRRAPE